MDLLERGEIQQADLGAGRSRRRSGLAGVACARASTSPRLGAGVKQGQVIGGVANTGDSFGAHLRIEVRINGAPVDPTSYR